MPTDIPIIRSLFKQKHKSLSGAITLIINIVINYLIFTDCISLQEHISKKNIQN